MISGLIKKNRWLKTKKNRKRKIKKEEQENKNKEEKEILITPYLTYKKTQKQRDFFFSGGKKRIQQNQQH